MFVENAAFLRGKGRCVAHGGECEVSRLRPHVASAGLPCQPFTGAREHSGATPRTGPPSQHPAFATVMEEWKEYLEARQPDCFFIEQVPEFDTPDPKGVSYLKRFTRMCAAQGYSMRALRLSHGIWVELPRERRSFSVGIFICSLSLYLSFSVSLFVSRHLSLSV